MTVITSFVCAFVKVLIDSLLLCQRI